MPVGQTCEGIEDALAVGLVHAASRVAYIYNKVLSRRNSYFHLHAAPVRIFHGVADEVTHDLLHAERIASPQVATVGGQCAERYVEALLCSHWLELFHTAFCQLLWHEAHVMSFRFSAFEQVIVEQGGNKLLKVYGRVAHAVDVGERFRSAHLFAEQFDKSSYRCCRCFYVVRNGKKQSFALRHNAFRLRFRFNDALPVSAFTLYVAQDICHEQGRNKYGHQTYYGNAHHHLVSRLHGVAESFLQRVLFFALYVFEQQTCALRQLQANPLQPVQPCSHVFLLTAVLSLFLVLYVGQDVGYRVGNVYSLCRAVGFGVVQDVGHAHRVGMLSSERIAQPSEEAAFAFNDLIHLFPLTVLPVQF